LLGIKSQENEKVSLRLQDPRLLFSLKFLLFRALTVCLPGQLLLRIETLNFKAGRQVLWGKEKRESVLIVNTAWRFSILNLK
jgi:hypothetical protein